MAIRLRTVAGVRVALCAAETDEIPGDAYLDDADHHALAAKFAHDWQGQTVDWAYEREWTAAGTQKLRNAQDELMKWQATILDEDGRPLPARPWEPPGPPPRRRLTERGRWIIVGAIVMVAGLALWALIASDGRFGVTG